MGGALILSGTSGMKLANCVNDYAPLLGLVSIGVVAILACLDNRYYQVCKPDSELETTRNDSDPSRASTTLKSDASRNSIKRTWEDFIPDEAEVLDPSKTL